MNRHERRAAKAKAKADAAPSPAAGAQGLAVLHAAILKETLDGRFLEALARCRDALAAQPENADTLHLMGIVHLEAKQADHAIEWVSRAIAKQTKPAYLTTLGIAHSALGRHNEALGAFERALQLAPDDAQLWWHKGMAFLAMNASFEALPCFERTLKLDPRHADAAYKCGFILHALERFDEALVHLNVSAALQPRDALTLTMRAAVLKELKRLDAALADSFRAVELDPGNAEIANSLGGILQILGRVEEALQVFERALQISPGNPLFMTNRASMLVWLGRVEEGAAVYREVLAAHPDSPDARLNLSTLQLLSGDFENGWPGLEMRFRIPAMRPAYPTLRGPMWLGEQPIAGKTILICADQGLGDSIQYARYVPMLAARGARVILAVEPILCPLLGGISGVSLCLPKLAETVLPPYDFHCAISSLPLAFGTRLDSVPNNPYLPPPAMDRVQAWERRLGPHEKLRVGLVWSGNPDHRNDRNRSMSLALMSGLFDVDARFVSLQKQLRPGDAEMLRERPGVIDLTSELTDFAETAALLSCLDLVITVDTSVAHAAAALGRPTWILLPQLPDYRWMFDRDDNAWYPSVRLFRQGGSRDYAGVIGRVRAELSARTETFARERRTERG